MLLLFLLSCRAMQRIRKITKKIDLRRLVFRLPGPLYVVRLNQTTIFLCQGTALIPFLIQLPPSPLRVLTWKQNSLIIFKIALCFADSTIRRAVLVVKNSQKALCNAWLQSFSSCPTVKRVANILEQLPKYLMSTLVSLL